MHSPGLSDSNVSLISEEASTLEELQKKRRKNTEDIDHDDKRLDSGEDGVDKKRRRLEKNREAAHQFRQRQKAYLFELEKKVQSLSTENADYKTKIDLLRSENQLVKEQLNYLRTFLSQAISLSFPLTSALGNNNTAPQNNTNIQSTFNNVNNEAPRQMLALLPQQQQTKASES